MPKLVTQAQQCAIIDLVEIARREFGSVLIWVIPQSLAEFSNQRVRQVRRVDLWNFCGQHSDHCFRPNLNFLFGC